MKTALKFITFLVVILGHISVCKSQIIEEPTTVTRSTSSADSYCILTKVSECKIDCDNIKQAATIECQNQKYACIRTCESIRDIDQRSCNGRLSCLARYDRIYDSCVAECDAELTVCTQATSEPYLECREWCELEGREKAKEACECKEEAFNDLRECLRNSPTNSSQECQDKLQEDLDRCDADFSEEISKPRSTQENETETSLSESESLEE